MSEKIPIIGLDRRSMQNSKWVYGVIMGVLLILMQVFNYRTTVRDLSVEIYGLALGLIFLGLGIWIGLQLYQGKITIKAPFRRNNQYPLSERELEVLRAMAEGLSNQEIADKLFVSLNTVKTHTSNIYSKLHVQRRTQAVRKARSEALI